MGNCMETYAEGRLGENKQEQEEEDKKAGGLVKEDGFEKGSFRVKIVLTKEELEWLMLELKKKGGRGLQEVLGEIEKGRGKVEGWKPSLESIMEIPELHEMDR
ncbi:hypothetical protein HHK36_001300 [Tetracentron sinense]|uniref:Uncharacterized protein n=1 Tax=Tetracentron sinense TaxID=13715 RepID=A0A834ZVT9_TETSI|nr:hypothetical protein HHK36_001300 [Tetracentron sinense]